MEELEAPFLYACMTCGARTWDSAKMKLAGGGAPSADRVSHDEFCPGKSFPANHVRRFTVFN